MSDPHIKEAQAEWDRLREKAVERQENINGRINSMKQDFDAIVTILDDNWDDLTKLRAEAYDQKYETKLAILEYMEDLAEIELNI